MSRWYHGDRPTETLRMLGLALAVLGTAGCGDAPGPHRPGHEAEALIATMLVKRTPFTYEEGERIVEVANNWVSHPCRCPAWWRKHRCATD